jgi:hypothetical protein
MIVGHVYSSGVYVGTSLSTSVAMGTVQPVPDPAIEPPDPKMRPRKRRPSCKRSA